MLIVRTALQSFERRGGRSICCFLLKTNKSRSLSRHDRIEMTSSEPFSSAC